MRQLIVNLQLTDMKGSLCDSNAQMPGVQLSGGTTIIDSKAVLFHLSRFRAVNLRRKIGVS